MSPYSTASVMTSNHESSSLLGGSNSILDHATIYRLPGERLGMALKFVGGTNAGDTVSRVFIQSINPDSPASRAQSNVAPIRYVKQKITRSLSATRSSLRNTNAILRVITIKITFLRLKLKHKVVIVFHVIFLYRNLQLRNEPQKKMHFCDITKSNSAFLIARSKYNHLTVIL